MLNATEFIIQTLIEDQKMTHADAEKLRAYITEHEVPFDEGMMRLNLASARDVAIAKSMICEYPFLEIDHFDVDIRNSRRLSKSIAERLRVFPLMVLGDIATVAMEDPLDLQAIDELRQVLRKQIDPVVVDALKLRSLIVRAYTLDSGGGHETVVIGDDIEVSNEQEPIVAAVNQILYSAAEFGASDIHLNPDEKQLHLRYRIDGVLQPNRGPDKSMHDSMIQRLKVMANLDVTQTRRPQDGKFRFKHKGSAIDVRLSLLPTIHGENAVMRLLSSASTIGEVSDLGMPADVTKSFGEMITKPHGIILVTGPTGSGKTTTLYTALNHINKPERNIMTIEDPVEIRLPLIRQVQAIPEIGLTFASALRSMLRQDPDVILVGEIRDEETAKIAVQAALTGHLVFSTLHTNDSVGAVPRLLEFGVPAFAINNALLGVIAQRLVRRVCEHCAEPEIPDQDLLRSFGIDPNSGASFVKGDGCPKCMSMGYKGRVGVYELFRMTTPIKKLIESSASSTEIADEAMRGGMRSMLMNGIEKAMLGQTTLEELKKLHATVDAVLTEKGPESDLKMSA